MSADSRSYWRKFQVRLGDSDLGRNFRSARSAQIGATILIIIISAALLAPIISPQNPYDLTVINILDAYKPPFFIEGGEAQFILGSDEQGRDVFSAVVYGLRVSIFVGVMGVFISAIIGVTLGIVGGYFGGTVDNLIMRLADIELSFPSILLALFIMYFWEPGIRNIIVAIGAEDLKPEGEYGYGKYSDVVTQLELEDRIRLGQCDAKNVVMIKNI